MAMRAIYRITFLEQPLITTFIYLCLPAHCSHLLQPLDVSVFRTAKVAWKKILKDHYSQTRLKKASVRKEVFLSLIAKLYDSAFKQEQVMSGFRKCGIFPFSRTVIPKEKMLPAQVVADSPNTPIASVDAANNSVAFDDTDFGVYVELTPRKAIREAVLNQLKVNQSTPEEALKRGPRVKRNHSNEVLTEDTVIEHIRTEEEAKNAKKMEAERRKAAAALKKLTNASISKAKMLKSKLNNKTKRKKRPAKQIFKDLTNNKLTEVFSDSEEDEDDPNDLDYVSELDGRSGNSKLRKKSSVSSAASALSESLINSVANEPQSGNLEELTINEWKLSLWVKVLYEGETFIGKVINIQNNEALVRCLEKPFGIDTNYFHDMEKEDSCAFYKTIYKNNVTPLLLQDGRKWRYKYTL